MPRSLLLGGALMAVALLATVSLFLGVEKRAAGGAPDFRVAATGGVQYEAKIGRPIDPANPIDRRIIAGLPARERRLHHGQILFGAFIAFTNASTHDQRSAARIELRHDAGQVYQPLTLPKTNPYAYSPRVIRAGSRIPSEDSPADENLAATGRLVLFRIPAREYSDGGTFELIIHDPLRPGRTTSLII